MRWNAAKDCWRAEQHLVVETVQFTGRSPNYAALKVPGIPVKLLQFEGEYHGTGSTPRNFIRTQLYMMSWFKRYVRTPEGKSVSVPASAVSE
jgi:hypothetical protein